MFRLYNTLTHKKEIFTPLRRGAVSYYTCGPSVYLQPHVGNFKTYVFEDVLRRWLEYSGYKVKHVMNLTDVEDKGVRQARGSMKKMRAQTDANGKMFFGAAEGLRLLKPAFVCKASSHVPDMIKLIEKLMARGYAYEWKEDGNIYFDISKFRKYGRLSRTPVEKFVKSHRRVAKDDYWQFEMGDFALWKARRPSDGDICWNSPWGKGRPGWNIECSAMSMAHLGPTIDIHAGGSDLVFSHHENEIAQSEGATGKKFVRWWVHGRHLLLNGKKMSKSLRNFYTVQQLRAKEFSYRAIRYMLAGAYYRHRLNFTFARLRKCEREIKKIDKQVEKLEAHARGGKAALASVKARGLAKWALKYFEMAMDDDLDTPGAMAAFSKLLAESAAGAAGPMGRISKHDARLFLDALHRMDAVLAIL
jgi:cysteinyl-tRNA synthetase